MKYNKSKETLEKQLKRAGRVIEMRNDGKTWKSICDELWITEPTAHKDYNTYANTFSKVLEENWFDKTSWGHWWLKVDGASIHIKNKEAEIDWDKIKSDIVEAIKLHSPKYEPVKYKKVKEWHLLIVDHADHHFWKYASKDETVNDYNIEKAKERFYSGLKWIIEKASWFNLDEIVFVIWNDVLHIDNTKRTTTSGTPQDTDGMWHEAYQEAKMCYVHTIEQLRLIAPVRVVFNPSNHDYMSGFMLAQTIQAWFHNDKNVIFDVSIKHRKYYRYGTTLIATTHWDGAKDTDMPLIIATEAPILWSESNFRYCYQHHVHHKIAKDYIWLTIEYLRSASGTDSWHDRNGYISKPAIDGFIISKEHWQVARLTHYF